MNKIFKAIWSETSGSWVAVAEITKAHKTGRNNKRKLAIAALAGAAALALTLNTTPVYAVDDITISNSPTVGVSYIPISISGVPAPYMLFTASDGSNNLNISDLTNYLNNNGIIPQTDNTVQTTTGDIIVAVPISWYSWNNLILNSGNDIDINAGSSITGTGPNGANITLNAANAININDSITIPGNLDLSAGSITIAPGANISDFGGYINQGTVAIGGSSIWTNSSDFYVGNTGSATLNITNGGTVSDINGYIGYNAGSTGVVTVDGTGSKWTNTGYIYVDSGNLNITDGGTVSDNGGVISYNPTPVYAVTVDGTGSKWINSGDLIIESGLSITSGGTVSDTNGYIADALEINGTVTVDGANSTWTNSSDLYVGQYGNGTLSITNGGTVSDVNGYITGFPGMEGYIGSASNSTVTVDGTNSVWTNSGDLYVGFNGSGTMNIAHGGTVSDNTGYIGIAMASTGTVTVDGANSAWTNSGDLYVGYEGTGNLTISNGGYVSDTDGYIDITPVVPFPPASGTPGSVGVVTVSGAGSQWENSGSLVVSEGGSGTLTISDGGEVSAASVTVATNSGTGVINIGAADESAAVAPGTLDTPTVDIYPTGSLVFNHTSDDYTFAPQITSTGSVIQDAGITVLTADNSTLGTTTVNGGALYINGNSTATTDLATVNSGGTLGGIGTIGGSITVQDGGILAPGNVNVPGTLTINGNLTLNDGSILNYRFGDVTAEATGGGGTLNDLTVVKGNIYLEGTSTLNVAASAGGTFGPGLYRLFDYTGTLTGTGSITIGDTPDPGGIYTIDTLVSNQVDLSYTIGTLMLSYWDAGNGTWNAATSNANWTDSSSSANVAYAQNSYAVFEGTPGTVIVDNSAGQVESKGMQFSVDGYDITGGSITLGETIAGTGVTEIRVGDGTAVGTGYTATIDSVLQGTTELEKTDYGTLVLTGANTYTGGTAINGGTLQISADDNLGDTAGGLSFDDGTLSTTADITSDRATTLNAGGGTFDVNDGTTLAMTGIIDGAGSLTKTDTGTLELAGVNTYTGGTTLENGTIVIGNNNALGTGTLAMWEGTTLAFDATGGYNIANSITLSGDPTFNVPTGTIDTQSGPVSDDPGPPVVPGTLELTGGGTLILNATNTYTGGTIIDAGTLQLGDGTTNGSIVGDVTNNGTLAFNRSDIVTFDGVISGTGAVTQIGTGTTILTAANTYSGGTTISAGTLQLGDGTTNGSIVGNITDNATLAFAPASGTLITNSGIITGTGAITQIGAGTTTLSGTGSSIGSVDVQTGTLAFTQAGAFTTTGAYTTESTGTTSIAAGSTLSIGGAFTQDGTLDIALGTSTTPVITAASATLSGTLNITGFGPTGTITASSQLTGNLTLISTTNGITENNLTVNTGSTGTTPNYITTTYGIVGNNYDLGLGLTWFSGTTTGNGLFTIATGTNFIVDDTILSDQAASATGWNGTTLDKEGAGTLTLDQINTYTGTTTIGAGTLALSGVGSIATSSGVTDNGTLNISGTTAGASITTISGTGTVNLGAETLTLTNASGTLSGAISGTGGGLTLAAGTETLGGNNSYTGATNVNAGTLILTGTNTSTATTIASGATLQLGNGGTTGQTATTAGTTITNNGTVNIDRSNAYSNSNILSGTGELIQSGTGTTTLSGAGSTQGSVLVQAGGLTFSETGAFTTTGNYETQSGATTSITGSTSDLAIGGEFIQDAGSTLNITKGTNTAITAATASINGTLNITGYSATTPTKSSQITGTDFVLIHTTGGITGNFTTVTGAGSGSSADYLIAGAEKSANGDDYLVGYELTWTSGPVTGNGIFTLASGSSFELDDTALNNEAASATGWNGQDLTENGAGTLILDQANGYTGKTTINGGILELNQNGSIANSSSVTINSGTLDISNIAGTTTTIQNLSGQAEGNITLAGKNLTINQIENLTYAGNFDQSNGSITKNEAGTLTLSGQTNWTGVTTISQGSLTLDGTTGGAQLVSNVTGQTGAVLNITNNATLTGIIDPVDVNITNGGTWNVTGNSTVGTLTSTDSQINFVAPPTNSTNPADYKILNGTAINGATAGQTPSTITMNTNLAANIGDLISTQTTSGSYAIEVNNTGGNITGKALPLEIINASNQSASTGNYTLTNGPLEVGLYNYNLLNGQQMNLGQANSANWYLAPSYGKELVTLLGASDQTSTWPMTNDSLLQRMGELRTSNSDETKHQYQTWVRGYGWQARANTNNSAVNYKENTYGIDLGTDKQY
ncbi:MAG: autotransporter-associated beta strand repeat-containing protein, partial [Desulfuromonadales bacterium]|nr:autotransporter-associated beta strand repeat-containing protein [Desulfuromonadales bacterium]